MKNAEQRKQASIARLKAENIPYIDWLPTIEEPDEVALKTPAEIARRVIACMIPIQAVFEQENDNYDVEMVFFFQELLNRFAVKNLTPKEVYIMEGRGNEQERIDMVWKYESCWALFWALGLVDELKFPSEPMTNEECQLAIDWVFESENIDDFLAKVKLRSLEDIMDAADLTYRYHWACVDARVKNEQPAQGLFESVVRERRAGLDWLFLPEADWDNPRMDT